MSLGICFAKITIASIPSCTKYMLSMEVGKIKQKFIIKNIWLRPIIVNEPKKEKNQSTVYFMFETCSLECNYKR